MDNITIHIIDIDGKKSAIQTLVDSDVTLMDVLRDAGFSMGNCGGMALCASCHCYIEENIQLNIPSIEEHSMLDQLHNSDLTKSRLVCQIPLSEKLNGIVLRLVR